MTLGLPEGAAIPVQRQLDAYKAHDIERFVAGGSSSITSGSPA